MNHKLNYISMLSYPLFQIITIMKWSITSIPLSVDCKQPSIRQRICMKHKIMWADLFSRAFHNQDECSELAKPITTPVSYTHLTLPTKA